MENIHVMAAPSTHCGTGENTLVDVFAVQIINIGSNKPLDASDPFLQCYTRPMSDLSEDSVKEEWSQYPEWLSYFMEMELAYQNSYCAKLDTKDPETNVDSLAVTLQERLNAAFSLEEDVAIALNEFDAYLYYNFGFRQWTLIYHLKLDVCEDDLLTLLQCKCESALPGTVRAEGEEAPSADQPYAEAVQSPDIRHDIDFYNTIRDLFAVSDHWCCLAPQVTLLQSEAKDKICGLMKRLYGIASLPKDKVVFPDSSTNVSFFYTMPQGSTHLQMARMKEVLRKANCNAERKKDEPIDMAYGEVFFYLFWGRFNTIELRPAGSDDRLARQLNVSHQCIAQYMPINFHAMLLWGYVMHMTEVMQAIEKSLLAAKAPSDKMRIKYFNALINSIDYAHFENETFRRGIEHDNETVYSVIENRWSLESSLTQLRDFATYLSDHLDHEYQENRMKSDNKQNIVLFVIALLGIFGLISIWDDYLDIVSEFAAQGAFADTILGAVFPTLSSLEMFSVGLPILTIVICVIAVIFMYRWRPR